MSKKYYTVFPGEVPSIHDREGKTREEIINSEISDKLAEVVVINYKYDFFKKNIVFTFKHNI